LSRVAHLAMAKKNGFRLNEVECQLFDKLFTELLQSVGVVSALFDCAAAAAVEPENRERFLRLAREASLGGTLTLKKLLWQWAGFRRHALEGQALPSFEAIIEALNADPQKTEAPTSDHRLLPASAPD
jgi:hypothetical protein